ncbi:hypothetical protein M9H77_33741 [Catharanthus roseus]|uniref:Uncharacterized protein n=1 Tax=Catharanthus roseus TaxID=4058 RepID=A0ACB9ZJ89_CATRO|nr:hypothetical protein M9H77_33741 [Catharanthus roseus]
MAPSPLRTITRKHARSVSLPSQSHPFMPQFDEHLSKVRASEATTSTLSSMSNRLANLNNLYDSTDDILLLPHIQQAISQECQDRRADELLDGYLRLLDACSATRDLFSQTKQSIQELLSALRRKDSDELSGYLTSRKNSKRIIQKALTELRSIRRRRSVIATEKENETVATLSMLKEVETITLTMFESFLSQLYGRKKQTGWSLVSKLTSTGVSNQEEEKNTNELEKVDNTLKFIISQKQSNKDDIEQVEAVQNQLRNILSSIETVEDELECLFRRLIKSRVSLLNILNH